MLFFSVVVVGIVLVESVVEVVVSCDVVEVVGIGVVDVGVEVVIVVGVVDSEVSVETIVVVGDMVVCIVVVFVAFSCSSICKLKLSIYKFTDNFKQILNLFTLNY